MSFLSVMIGFSDSTTPLFRRYLSLRKRLRISKTNRSTDLGYHRWESETHVFEEMETGDPVLFYNDGDFCCWSCRRCLRKSVSR